MTKSDYVEKVSDLGDFNFKGSKPCLIKFETQWCGGCKSMEPVIKEVLNQYPDKLDFYKVDAETETDLANNFDVLSVPTFLFISKDGKLEKETGIMNKTKFNNKVEDIIGM
jgi:thioredoxin